MAAPILLRADYDGATLRELAKASSDANQTRRLLALAVIYDGGRWGDSAQHALRLFRHCSSYPDLIKIGRRAGIVPEKHLGDSEVPPGWYDGYPRRAAWLG